MKQGAHPKGSRVEARGLSLYYGEIPSLKELNLVLVPHSVTALIGPAGCGKSTFLRTLNRMHDLNKGIRLSGQVLIDGEDIYAPGVDVSQLRKKIGMVFPQPNPFPHLSIFENVVFGLKLHGRYKRRELEETVEWSLKKVALWDEVQDRLHQPVGVLSRGQQQCLCIARCLAIKPTLLLMDEPCSALDPVATMRIEELIPSLKKDYTVLIVTNNLHQVGRISDYTAFLLNGQLVEDGPTAQIFENPGDPRTEAFITGRFV